MRYGEAKPASVRFSRWDRLTLQFPAFLFVSFRMLVSLPHGLEIVWRQAQSAG